MFRKLRIALLLTILAIVSLGTYWQSTANENWDKAFRLTVYPVEPFQDQQSKSYINSLSEYDFADITTFLQSQARDYSLPHEPQFYISLGPVLTQAPPAPPAKRSILNMMKWSIRLRYWLFSSTSSLGLDSRHIRVFVVYHKVEKNRVLAHSYGLQKGLLGVVNAFAGSKQTGTNNVIIAHELLHLLGATDKYNSLNLPIYPDGYASPDKSPLYPQSHAEIMGGRIPLDQHDAVIPDSLEQCVIGTKTAAEINWL